MSYLAVSIGDVLNTTNSETDFLRKQILKEHFEIKVQEGSVLKYLNFRFFQSFLGFRVDHTDHIMELLTKWFPNGNLIKFDTTFRIDYTYEKELMPSFPLTGNALHKVEMEYHIKLDILFEGYNILIL